MKYKNIAKLVENCSETSPMKDKTKKKLKNLLCILLVLGSIILYFSDVKFDTVVANLIAIGIMILLIGFGIYFLKDMKRKVAIKILLISCSIGLGVYGLSFYFDNIMNYAVGITVGIIIILIIFLLSLRVIKKYRRLKKEEGISNER